MDDARHGLIEALRKFIDDEEQNETEREHASGLHVQLADSVPDVPPGN